MRPARRGLAQLEHVKDGHRGLRRPRGAVGVQVPSDRTLHYRARRPRWHRAPVRSRGLWSGQPGAIRSLFRGKCLGETASVQARGPVRTRGETVAAVSKPCLSARYGTGRDTRGGGGERAAARERPPPKTALACTGGPFGEVASRIFPCRKAGWQPMASGSANQVNVQASVMTWTGSLS